MNLNDGEQKYTGNDPKNNIFQNWGSIYKAFNGILFNSLFSNKIKVNGDTFLIHLEYNNIHIELRSDGQKYYWWMGGETISDFYRRDTRTTILVLRSLETILEDSDNYHYIHQLSDKIISKYYTTDYDLLYGSIYDDENDYYTTIGYYQVALYLIFYNKNPWVSKDSGYIKNITIEDLDIKSYFQSGYTFDILVTGVTYMSVSFDYKIRTAVCSYIN